MKIVRFEAIPFTIPLKRDQLTFSAASRGVVETFDAVLIRLYTDEGLIGIGEAPARPNIYGDSQASIVSAIHHLGPSLIGTDPRDLEQIAARLAPHVAPVGNLTAKGALDIAVYDIVGKALGLPAYKFLGEWLDTPIVQLWWTLMIGDPRRVVAVAMSKVEEGYRAFKVKVGYDDARDISVIRELRRTLGDAVQLHVDANQAYSADRAIIVLTRMAEYGVAWVEDPCRVDLPIATRKRIAAALPMPILGDDSCFTPANVLHELQEGTAGMILIKVARSGYHNARRILQLAAQFGAPCVVGAQGDSAIGSLAAAHFVAALRGVQQPAGMSYMDTMEGQIIRGHSPLVGAEVHLLDDPGIGVEIDEDCLRKYATTPSEVGTSGTRRRARRA